jgi:haloalkane dehalogenase
MRSIVFSLLVACSGTQAKETGMTPILDSTMFHREAGAGPVTVVFLHGNPTSSHLWRNVIPHVAPRARCLAPDLIGMGKSGKPDIAYRFVDHARYLDAWFDALDLRDVVLVGHDWGGALAMDWAARHPDRVRGLVVLETFLRPMHWDDWLPQGRELFRALRTPGAGEQIVLEQNQFLAKSLEHGIKRGVTPEDSAAYNAPFPTPASRKPVLQWPREIPVEGEPADVTAIVERYGAWLASSKTPKLLLTFEGASPLVSEKTIAWARATATALEIRELGPAGHHAPEDRPDEIGRAIQAFLAVTK